MERFFKKISLHRMEFMAGLTKNVFSYAFYMLSPSYHISMFQQGLSMASLIVNNGSIRSHLQIELMLLFLTCLSVIYIRSGKMPYYPIEISRMMAKGLANKIAWVFVIFLWLRQARVILTCLTHALLYFNVSCFGYLGFMAFGTLVVYYDDVDHYKKHMFFVYAMVVCGLLSIDGDFLAKYNELIITFSSGFICNVPFKLQMVYYFEMDEKYKKRSFLLDTIVDVKCAANVSRQLQLGTRKFKSRITQTAFQYFAVCQWLYLGLVVFMVL